MHLDDIVDKIKKSDGYPKVGMILCHNGVVRSTSRDGRSVREITVQVDRGRLERLLAEMRNSKGIVDVLAEIREGTLYPGEDIMVVAVAGDIRENVFPVLMETVNRIKAEVTRKTER